MTKATDKKADLSAKDVRIGFDEAHALEVELDAVSYLMWDIAAALDSLHFGLEGKSIDPEAPGVLAILRFIEDGGRAEGPVDNTGGAAGAKRVQWRRGLFAYASAAGADTVTEADIDTLCYSVDDQTVAATDGSGTRSPAGFVDGVNGAQVWVRCDAAWARAGMAAEQPGPSSRSLHPRRDRSADRL